MSFNIANPAVQGPANPSWRFEQQNEKKARFNQRKALVESEGDNYVFKRDVTVYEDAQTFALRNRKPPIDFKKGDVISGVIETIPEGYGKRIQIVFLKNDRIYNTHASNVEKKEANLLSNKNLLILAVIVGGYFAYKKFKK